MRAAGGQRSALQKAPAVQLHIHPLIIPSEATEKQETRVCKMELLFLVKLLEIQSYNESDSNANIVTKALRQEDFLQFNRAFG